MNAVDVHNVVANGRQSVGIPHSSYAPRTTVTKVKKAPECPVLENRNWLIHLHYARKEFGICKILIQEELEKSNGMCEFANYVQGLILRHEGKIQESLEKFQTCHTLNPRSVDNIKQVARSLYLLGRHRLAMEAYLEAEGVSDKPDWDIYHSLGMCLFHLNDLPKAKVYVTRSIQLSGQECSFVALAKIHLMEGDIQEAINIYIAAIDSFPDNSELATNLGLLYMKSGRYQQAFEKLGSALAHDPSCTKALLAAGAMMQGHQDVDVALSKYKIASQYLPESAPLWNNIGMCFFEKKKFVAAISCLKRANYLSPFDWKTLYNLGLVHLSTQQYASAFHFLSAAINLQPNSATTFMLLALSLKHLQDPENTCQAFEQAAKLDPNDATVPLNYAIFLHSVGEIEQATAQLRKFQFLAEVQKNLSHEMLGIANKLSMSLSKSNDVKSEAIDNGTLVVDNPRQEDVPASSISQAPDSKIEEGKFTEQETTSDLMDPDEV